MVSHSRYDHRAGTWRWLQRLIFVLITAWVGTPLAAAENPLPFGKSLVPRDLQPLMQRPVGISLLALTVDEPMEVRNLALTLGGQRLPPGMVVLPAVSHTTHVTGVHVDAWLLPFLGVHGLVAHISGTASDIQPTIAPGLLPPGVTIPSTLDYSGTSYGAGLTLAAGYRRLFASYDVTVSSTTVDLLRDRVSSVAQSIRAGVRASTGRIRTSLYLGAFHESVRGTLSGTGLIPVLNPEFSLEAEPRGAWNPLLGANIELTPRFVITAEAGLGTRKQLLIAPGVRF